MNEQRPEKPIHGSVHSSFFHNLDKSALLTVLGVILLFSTSVGTVLIAPLFVDDSWTTPSSLFQVQMYEVEDPHLYISSAASPAGTEVQQVRHLKQGFSLLAFKESENQRIIAPQDLDQYITRYQDPKLKLTSRLLLLREPEGDSKEIVGQMNRRLQSEWEEAHPGWQQEGLAKPSFHILELYDSRQGEAFSYEVSSGILPNWVDENFTILEEDLRYPYQRDYGVVYVQNPVEYRISPIHFGNQHRWRYDPDGKPVASLDELKSSGMGFFSRKELIYLGEHIYAIEGCWYCHTDQTRTLVQDVVLNGSESYPAPPSSPNEYVYQKITFPGTRRIGPDLSRVGIKRPSRDWHKSHFWAPKTASAGSIMPAFQHFFDNDPRGTGKSIAGIPNVRFEAIFQYLMTKGTRITPPTRAWWLGKDPVQTKEIIEGLKTFHDRGH